MSRLFALGLDGVGLDVWLRLRDRGWLPKLGSRFPNLAPLASTTPAYTAPAWTSIATGLNPGRHGVLDFWTRPAPGRPRTILGSSALPTFWEAASAQGFGIGVFNYPLSYPPRQINGFWVSGMNTPRGVTDFAAPSSLNVTLADYEPGEEAEMDPGRDLRHRLSDRLALLRELIRLQANDLRAGLTVLRISDPASLSLLVFGLTSTDRFLHFFWDCVAADAEGAPQVLVEAAREFWLALDEGVDEWLEVASPDDLLLFSDHGFEPYPPAVFNVSAWLRGIEWTTGAFRADRPKLWRKELGLLKDLARRRLPEWVWRRLRRDRLASAAGPVRAECLYGPLIGLSAEFGSQDAVNAAMAAAMGTVDHAGRPVFLWAKHREDLWPGAPADFPDAALCLRDGLGAGFSAADPRLIFPAVSERLGDHAPMGIVGFSTVAIPPDAPALRVWDVAPIALIRIGAAIPAELDGKAPGWIPGERAYVAPLRAGSVGSGGYSPEQTEELTARLKTLGYLD